MHLSKQCVCVGGFTHTSVHFSVSTCLHDLYKCMQLLCSCACVCTSPEEKPSLRLSVTTSHTTRSRPVSHAAQPHCSSTSSLSQSHSFIHTAALNKYQHLSARKIIGRSTTCSILVPAFHPPPLSIQVTSAMSAPIRRNAMCRSKV